MSPKSSMSATSFSAWVASVNNIDWPSQKNLSTAQQKAELLAILDRAEALKLEIAADYLVMAAWLAYLKSAMLLPKEEQEDPSPEELALRLQLRLERLGALWRAAS